MLGVFDNDNNILVFLWLYKIRKKYKNSKYMNTSEIINLENQVQVVLADMENKGIMCNKSILEETSKVIKEELNKIKKEIYKEAGQEFNILSTKELGEILFNKLNMPKMRKNKTGYSTDEKVLIKLSDLHPVPKLILQYRHLSKLQSTYINGLITAIDEDGFIRSTFLQNTSTGRISSKNPNMQNLPSDDDVGKLIKQAFTPRKTTYKFISFDYSQIELRIFAHIANEENMIKAFKGSKDIHSETAKLIFEKEEITSQERNFAKSINFGILYGMEAFGLSQTLNIPVEEANSFLKKYFDSYPRIKDYFANISKELEEHEFVKSLIGRKRDFKGYNRSAHMLKKKMFREAINMPIQGTSADINKIAMCNIYNFLLNNKLTDKAFIVLVVHDEIILEIDEGIIEDKFINEIKKIMENALTLEVPLVVNYKVGDNLSFS